MLAVVLLTGATVLTLGSADDHGITWDETIHMDYGDAVLDYFLSFGQDDRASAHKDRAYIPGYDLLGAVARRLSPLEAYQSMRALGVVVGLLGAVGAYRLACLLGGSAAGCLALFMLLLTPAYEGQIYSNPKDLPFAVGYIWALYALARAARRWSERRWSDHVLLALGLAAALMTRIAGLLTLAYLLGLWLIYLLQQWRMRGSVREALRGSGGDLLQLSLVAAGALLAMILVWPAAHAAPLEEASDAVTRFSHYSRWKSTTLFDGQWLTSDRLPWNYLPAYLLRQLPESVLALGALGILGNLTATLHALRHGRPLPMAGGLLTVAILLPPVYAILSGARIYDGLRHFLFIVPPLCVAAALAGRWLISRAWGKAPTLGALVGMLALLPLLDAGLAMVRLHPYHYVYYNRSSGGFVANQDRWDTDYYGQSFLETHQALRAHLWREDPEDYLNRRFRITGCHAAPFLWVDGATPGNLDFVHLNHGKEADFFVSYTRHGCHRRFPQSPVVLEVKRQGRTLNLVKELHPGHRSKPGEH